MPLADYLTNNEILTDATALNFEKDLSEPEAEFKPLIYYYAVGGNWEQGEVPGEILQVKIGSDPKECEILLELPEVDKVQIVLRHIADTWYIIEAGKNDLMKVNGLKKRQVQLPDNSKVVVQIDDITFVFSTMGRKIVQPTEPLTGAPEEGKGEFSLALNNKEYRYPFQKPCFIGSSPECDFYLDGEAFAGLIFPIGKRLFFTPLVLNSDTQVTTDGLPIQENSPLVPGSKIQIGDNVISFRLSKELRFSQDFKFIPDPKEECLMLLQLDEYGNPGKAYALPPAGRSVFIGRDPSQSGITIPDSRKISRRHAQAIMYNKSLLLVDNGATNGTYVNSKRIKKKLVRPGNIIRFGDKNFILCFVG